MIATCRHVHDIMCVGSGQRDPELCPFFKILISYIPIFCEKVEIGELLITIIDRGNTYHNHRQGNYLSQSQIGELLITIIDRGTTYHNHRQGKYLSQSQIGKPLITIIDRGTTYHNHRQGNYLSQSQIWELLITIIDMGTTYHNHRQGNYLSQSQIGKIHSSSFVQSRIVVHMVIMIQKGICSY